MILLGVLVTGNVSALGQSEGQVDHLVLAKLKAEATQAQIDSLTEALLTMKKEVPGIIDIAAGVNNSPEGMDKGHNYAVYVRFKDIAARDAYLTNSYHQGIVVEYAVPILEDLTIVDFER